MATYMEKHQNKMRQEKKFIINNSNVISFEKELILNNFKVGHLPNLVNNIYFEDNFFSSTIENIEGNNVRSKHRIRWYNNQKEFTLEEKIKLSSSGIKKREKINCKNLEEAINIVERKINKKAIIQNSYFRKYYINENIRVTIDLNLKFFIPKTNSFKFFDKSIIEIKFDTKDITEIESFIKKNGLKLTKNSKFLQGITYFKLYNNSNI